MFDNYKEYLEWVKSEDSALSQEEFNELTKRKKIHSFLIENTADVPFSLIELCKELRDGWRLRNYDFTKFEATDEDFAEFRISSQTHDCQTYYIVLVKDQ